MAEGQQSSERHPRSCVGRAGEVLLGGYVLGVRWEGGFPEGTAREGCVPPDEGGRVPVLRASFSTPDELRAWAVEYDVSGCLLSSVWLRAEQIREGDPASLLSPDGATVGGGTAADPAGDVRAGTGDVEPVGGRSQRIGASRRVGGVRVREPAGPTLSGEDAGVAAVTPPISADLPDGDGRNARGGRWP